MCVLPRQKQCIAIEFIYSFHKYVKIPNWKFQFFLPLFRFGLARGHLILETCISNMSTKLEGLYSLALFGKPMTLEGLWGFYFGGFGFFFFLMCLTKIFSDALAMEI